jgi:hypothetical protein
MDLFVEKEFIEEFEYDYYCSENKSDIQKIVFSIFTEYSNIKLFIDAPDSFIFENELLSKLTDTNRIVSDNIDFDNRFNKQFSLSHQTLVFTKNTRSWFSKVKDKGALYYSYADYESEIQKFITDTHFKIDLSDPENIPMNWKIFRFLNSQTNFIILSDRYVLCDGSGQEMRKNLIPLLKDNLNKNHPYSIFIFTEVDDDIDKKIGQLNSALNGYHPKIYVFNIVDAFENIDLHDRILYSNYTLTVSGKGFNLYSTKPSNSEIDSNSIFEKHTYKRLISHFKELDKYVFKLENSDHLNNPYRTNNKMAFAAFKAITSH